MATPALEGSGVDGGFAPADIRSAYKLAEAGGKGSTVAITIAYDDPHAESDLATYRSHYGLSACTTANGCFKKVNQKGESKNYPPNAFKVVGGAGWALELALDMEMVSAVCPECKITVVEANNPQFQELGAAENTAAELGTVVNNSWGGIEHAGQTEEDSLYYNHPGIPLLFSSGDSGYVTSWPSSSANTISVGGTSLFKDAGKRGWRETAWAGAGSGCSKFEEKPKWQTDAGCAKRAASDVSAVADSSTPVSVYAAEFAQGGQSELGWLRVGGTSAAAPILAGVEARLSTEERAEGAKLFWKRGPEGKLFDVADGRNGHCAPEIEYLCDARVGYDGPSGWGTPGATSPGPPVVGTYDPSGLTPSKATLNGAVNPNGKSTSYHFEWGTTTSYGNQIPSPEGSAGSGTSPVGVSASLSGLTLGTTYHYRLVATSAEGTTYGADQTFEPTRWTPHFVPQNSSSKLTGISCALGSSCNAVGREFVENENEPGTGWGNDGVMADLWNGSKWTQQTVPKPHPIEEWYTSYFTDISCISTTSCMAVGSQWMKRSEPENVRIAPLVEQWNGSEWSILSTPLPSDAYSDETDGKMAELYGVSCVSTTACVAVGSYVSAIGKNSQITEEKTLVESWDGSKWSVVSSPSFEKEANFLTAVSCISATFCRAVGYHAELALGNTVSGSAKALVESWDGSKWSIESAQNVSGVDNYLTGVACTSASSCLAVGHTGRIGQEGGLAELWDGSEWTLRSAGHPLMAVSCIVADRCVGVGGIHSYYLETEEGLGLEKIAAVAYADVWNGSEWTPLDPTVPTDALGKGMQLLDVSCRPDICSAVGWYESNGQQILSENLELYPRASTEAATTVKATEATLHGSVNPEGSETSYWFEYGPTTSYGTKVPLSAKAIGAGTEDVAVSEEIANLQPSATYHFRVVAENAWGTTNGKDLEFTTALANFSLAFGSKGSGDGQFFSPRYVAVDSSGNAWVTDSNNNRVQKFNAKGEYVSKFGFEGTGNGQFVLPYGIAIDTAGNLWVVDRGNKRVEKFNAKGEYVSKFGSYGNGNGQLFAPDGIAIDASGNLWVVDAGNHRVQKFNSKGEYLAQFGSSGTGNGQFGTPRGIAIDASGNLWVTDTTNNRVQKFNPKGEYLAQFGTAGSGNGQFSSPSAVAIDSADNIWVTDSGNNRVQKFNPKGEYLAQFGSKGSGNGQLNAPYGITTNLSGNLWIADTANNRIQVLAAPPPAFSLAFGSKGTGNGQFQYARGIAIDSTGNLWIADANNCRVQEFNSKGEYLSKFGLGSYGGLPCGSGNGQFNLPYDLTIDSTGNIWVLDTNNQRVQEFNSKGEYLSKFGSSGSGNGQFQYARGIAIDSSGNFWIADTGNNRVEGFNSKGEYLSQFGSYGKGNGQLNQPDDLAIDPSGNIWVTDTGNHRVQVFNPKGEYLSQFGSLGSAKGQLDSPYGIAIDAAGNLWIADDDNYRVQEFNPKGEYLSRFGSYGDENGQFHNPTELAFDASGNLWITDGARVTKWVH